MEVIKNPKEMQEIADSLRKKGLIGFVPTMGALHKGHLSLLEKAREENDYVILSIFVNPLQFGLNEDYEKYPRLYEQDYKLAKEIGTDYLFHPEVDDIYPQKQETFVKIPYLEGILCGKSRPLHFQGVLTIVAKLFNIIKPHNAYFGQKDFQQAIMIKKMTKGLNFDINVQILPTIRENDGLAMSSRNAYLTTAEREKATILYQSLLKGCEMLKEKKPPSYIISQMAKMIEKQGFEIDYIEIIDTETLEKEIQNKTLIAIAASIGNTRLIDNYIY